MGPVLHRLGNGARRVRNAVVDQVWRRLPGTFACPLCGHTGSFAPSLAPSGNRRWARCPACGAAERHRLQAHVVRCVLEPAFADRRPRVLHVAPERMIGRLLAGLAGSYETADLYQRGVDHRFDLRDIPFPDASFDLVYASHVLEHIEHDRVAIAEIRRVVAPGGIAVLPVPLTGSITVEYPEPNVHEAFHWRAPGVDYFERLAAAFDRVDVVWSHDAPLHTQPYVFENRSGWPNRRMPRRVASLGPFHVDGVPICHVDAGTRP